MTTKEMIEVMQAYERGEQIEYRENSDRYHNLDEWRDASGLVWDWYEYEYRVKPQPAYRPYKDASEFLQAQKEHGMYLKQIASDKYQLPVIIDNDMLEFILVDYTWQDGTPCGIRN